jgi:hypothetical protein
VPLCKSAGTKQLKVVHGASATCVLQNADSGLTVGDGTRLECVKLSGYKLGFKNASGIVLGLIS